MLSPEKIQFYLDRFEGLRLEDLSALFHIAKERKLKAGETCIREGETCNLLFYIKQGLIRSYAVKNNGEEATIRLHWEDRFFASQDAVFFKRPSRFYYQAVEDTVLLVADYADIQKILYGNPALEQGRSSFLLHMLAEALSHVESFILLSPEDRYLQLFKERSDLFQRVPNKYIASLLGITPVSLSRIRKRISSRT